MTSESAYGAVGPTGDALDDKLLLLLELFYALGVAGLLVPHERFGLVEPQLVELILLAPCLDACDIEDGGPVGAVGPLCVCVWGGTRPGK